MLEVCVDSVRGAIIAANSGAQRIELCDLLDVGGITPSETLIVDVRRNVSLPIVVLIRCRPGDFEYTTHELDSMLAQCERAVQLGAGGLALGGLKPGKELDYEFLSMAKSLALNAELVVHRAFDSVSNPEHAIHRLIDMGFHRILSSGGPVSATGGLDQLRLFVEWANHRIQILPAGGVGPENAREILERTACTQLHGSFRNKQAIEDRKSLPDSKAIQETRSILDEFMAQGNH
ncbi:MAG: copper homeostasis protein CutC [Pirellula sp.]